MNANITVIIVNDDALPTRLSDVIVITIDDACLTRPSLWIIHEYTHDYHYWPYYYINHCNHLKLFLIPTLAVIRHYFRQSPSSNPHICCTDLSISTCDQLIKSCVDENVLNLYYMYNIYNILVMCLSTDGERACLDR